MKVSDIQPMIRRLKWALCVFALTGTALMMVTISTSSDLAHYSYKPYDNFAPSIIHKKYSMVHDRNKAFQNEVLYQNNIDILHVNYKVIARDLLYQNITYSILHDVNKAYSNDTNLVSEGQSNKTSAMQNHIGFLKVHKAGSSTIQNMMFRFGLTHDLTFALPKTSRSNYLFNKANTIPLKWRKFYDIFACHTKYSAKWFSSLLPADSVNIGIVREPLQRMISAAYFYRDHYGAKYLLNVPRSDFISNLVNDADKYEKNIFSYTKNSMGNDFGFSGDIHEHDKIKIAEKMKNLKHEFQLVLVMERFEESLVLLKRTFNWRMSDVMYLQTNSFQHNQVSLNETEKAKFRSTCFMDVILYETFYKIFDEKVTSQGSDFQEELTFYKSVLVKLREFCLGKEVHQAVLEIQGSKWNSPFSIARADCELMKLHEIKFISRLRTRHFEKF